MAEGGDLCQEFMNDLESKLGVGHFASAELEGDFHLHILDKEINGVLDFNAEIVWINLGAELDLVDLVGVLMLLLFLVALGLFVTVFAVIDQPAHRRGRVGGDFHQVDFAGPGQVQGFSQLEHPKLFAVRPDYPHLTGTNFPVYPGERTGRRRGT